MRALVLLFLSIASLLRLLAQEPWLEQIILNRGYGSANLEWNIPNSPTTKFRLGSVTKQFTAASVLLLAERGKWKLSDRVKQYMPDAPAAWDRITIHQLLTHTSGIPNFTSFSEYRDTEVEATTPEQLVKRFRDKPLDSDPGTKWSYSNSGYVLLGYLLEKVSEETYQKFRRISSRRSICRISVTTRTQPSFCIARPDTRLRKTELSTADILT